VLCIYFRAGMNSKAVWLMFWTFQWLPLKVVGADAEAFSIEVS